MALDSPTGIARRLQRVAALSRYWRSSRRFHARLVVVQFDRAQVAFGRRQPQDHLAGRLATRSINSSMLFMRHWLQPQIVVRR